MNASERYSEACRVLRIAQWGSPAYKKASKDLREAYLEVQAQGPLQTPIGCSRNAESLACRKYEDEGDA